MNLLWLWAFLEYDGFWVKKTQINRSVRLDPGTETSQQVALSEPDEISYGFGAVRMSDHGIRTEDSDLLVLGYSRLIVAAVMEITSRLIGAAAMIAGLPKRPRRPSASRITWYCGEIFSNFVFLIFLFALCLVVEVLTMIEI